MNYANYTRLKLETQVMGSLNRAETLRFSVPNFPFVISNDEKIVASKPVRVENRSSLKNEIIARVASAFALSTDTVRSRMLTIGQLLLLLTEANSNSAKARNDKNMLLGIHEPEPDKKKRQEEKKRERENAAVIVGALAAPVLAITALTLVAEAGWHALTLLPKFAFGGMKRSARGLLRKLTGAAEYAYAVTHPHPVPRSLALLEPIPQ